MHKGSFASSRVKRDLVLAVDPSSAQQIEGSTDSEVFFFLALSLGLVGRPTRARSRGRWA